MRNPRKPPLVAHIALRHPTSCYPQFTVKGLCGLVGLAAVVFAATKFWGVCVGFSVSLLIAAGCVCYARETWFRIAAAASAILLILGIALPLLDVIHHGPYVTWYNKRCQTIATTAGLVGKPEEEVVRVLGEPTSVYEYWDAVDFDSGEPEPGAEETTTFNFAPYSFFPFAKFQVHCRKGKVRSLELFDD